MSKNFTMLVGLPGCGKTTYRKEKCQNIVEISSDDFIEKMASDSGLTYNEVFKEQVKNATCGASSMFVKAVAEGRDIVWDQTNLTKKKRMGILDQLPNDYIKTCVVFNISEDVLIKRRAGRDGKTIPEGILRSMKSSFEQPCPSEGWDYVMEITN